MRFSPDPKTFTPPKEKTRMKTVRTDNTGKLRKKLDTVFAKYIRALSKKCYTCDRGKNDHAGHYLRRGLDSVRWNILNVKPQCWNCNILLGGNQDEFRKRLIVEYGLEAVEGLEQLSRVAVKFSADELMEMIQKYK